MFRTYLHLLIVVTCLSGSDVLAAGQNTVSFNGDIRPILSDRCFTCHGPSDGDRKGDLRLDVADGDYGALTRREDGFSPFIIKPGEPEESELWYRITTDEEDDRMPPADSHEDPLTAGGDRSYPALDPGGWGVRVVLVVCSARADAAAGGSGQILGQ